MADNTIQGPRGAAAPTPIAPSATGSGKAELGKSEFLQLLITQLRYQDPINPQKPEEFASQLAQFSSLERMQNIESLLEQSLSASALSTLAAKADLGASFIGRNVLVAGNEFEVTSEGPASVNVEVGPGGGKAVLRVLDESGKEVAKKDLGFRSAGRQVLATPDLPAGKYTYEVTVTSLAGEDVPVTTYTSGVVDGVSFTGGQVVLRSGGLNFLLDNIVEVEQVSAGQAAVAALRGARIIPSQMESVHS